MILTTGFTDLSAEAHRNQTAAFLPFEAPAAGTNPLTKAVGGVQTGLQFTKVSGLTFTIGSGRAVIAAGAASDGAYVVTNTDDDQNTFDPGETSTWRRDVVALQIDPVPAPVDPTVTPDPNAEPDPGASFIIIKGAPQASLAAAQSSAALPVIPDDTIALYSAILAPGATDSNIGIDLSKVVVEYDLLQLLGQDSLPYAMAAGLATLSVNKSANVASVGITFPPGRFSVPPIVTVALANAPGGTQTMVARSYGQTATGATLAVYSGNWPTRFDPNTGTMSVNLAWQAIQMTSAMAAG